jgi:pyruvate/2-oxoacid:ferredoxin oxidoreductase alpha subunit
MHLFSDLLANVSAEIIQMDSSHTPLEDISDCFWTGLRVFVCVCGQSLHIL